MTGNSGLRSGILLHNGRPREEVEKSRWKLYVDGSCNELGSGAGVMLISPQNQKITAAVRFKFKASNNDAKYEAILARLCLAAHLRVEELTIYSDSQLVVSQINDEYQAKGDKMIVYLKKVKQELANFRLYDVIQIPRAENSNADALARLATSKDADLLKVVLVEQLDTPSIDEIDQIGQSINLNHGCPQSSAIYSTQDFQKKKMKLDILNTGLLDIYYTTAYSIGEGTPLLSLDA